VTVYIAGFFVLLTEIYLTSEARKGKPMQTIEKYNSSRSQFLEEKTLFNLKERLRSLISPP